MSMKLEEFARESRATHKGDKSGVPIVGLEHLIPQEIKFSGYDVDTENTFTKTFKKGQILFGRRRAYLKKAAIADFDGICSGDITVIEAIRCSMGGKMHSNFRKLVSGILGIFVPVAMLLAYVTNSSLLNK